MSGLFSRILPIFREVDKFAYRAYLITQNEKRGPAIDPLSLLNYITGLPPIRALWALLHTRIDLVALPVQSSIYASLVLIFE